MSLIAHLLEDKGRILKHVLGISTEDECEGSDGGHRGHDELLRDVGKHQQEDAEAHGNSSDSERLAMVDLRGHRIEWTEYVWFLRDTRRGRCNKIKTHFSSYFLLLSYIAPPPPPSPPPGPRKQRSKKMERKKEKEKGGKEEREKNRKGERETNSTRKINPTVTTHTHPHTQH